MRIGIVGGPNSGKTTIFNALTRSATAATAYSSGRLEVHTAVVDVPDPRLGILAQMFAPRKAVYAQVTYNDIAGLTGGAGNEGQIGGPLLNAIAANDALLLVARAFHDPNVLHPDESVDPGAAFAALETEFLLNDMVTIDGRLERIAAQRSRGPVEERQRLAQEEALLTRLYPLLEEGSPLREATLSDDERKLLGGFGFLSLKPVLRVINAGDEDEEEMFSDHLNEGTFFLRGRLEAEIALMTQDEAAEFLDGFGIVEQGLNRAIRRCYRLLGLISFFTIGDNEVRSWAVGAGSTAPEAAGAVHTDMQKGFIRAETVHFDSLKEAGSMAEARNQGLLRLEGKEYVVQDGDVLNFRFNV
jgi:GTP-binding protein YchF